MSAVCALLGRVITE